MKWPSSFGLTVCLSNGPLRKLNSVKLRSRLSAQARIRSISGRIDGIDAMDSEVISRAEADERILTFDVPDEALERAASAEWQAVTWVYCTHPWYYCPWPQ